MPRDSPRPAYRGHEEAGSSRYRHDSRDHYSGRGDDRGSRRDRDDNYRDRRDRGDSSRKHDNEQDREGDRRRREDDSGRDRARDRDRYRDEDRGYGRGRDEPRRDRDGRDRDSRRAGSSRRSASPRPRSIKPESPSGSRAGSAAAEDKAKPNFAPSGLLAAATKTVEHGDGTKTVLKYHEPPEARKPSVGWRLYVFKGKEQVDLMHIQRQSAYLIGRDRAVVDIPVEHPSCSKQHAVIQYRQVQEKNEFGDVKSAVKPFIIDLESTNGTIVNDEAIPTSRYVELMAGDVIKFGESAREYVLLSDDAA
ncbi:SMAD/FHA domain-containing protein [Lentinus brumalis]|uniref:SMAD/FHA domain-containing protein n=1 Tax=Lentinus brumalis TaxID=2498619 RepID=A0A371DL73_9APHY|nr:SMAD/FHA domain-containing protein [Polyporus brumalis]